MAERWQVAHQRGQQTTAVWGTFGPGFQVGTVTLATHTADVALLTVQADARGVQQDVVDDARLARDANFDAMRDIVVRVPQLIEATLEEEDLLQNDLADIFGIIPNSQANVQERARRVISFWNRVNALRAAMTPALPPLLLGTVGVADLQTRLTTHPVLLQTLENEKSELNQKKGLLTTTARRIDRNNKRWYAAWSKNFAEGSPEHNALSQITTESGTSEPTPLEIDTLTADGDNVDVGYVEGGGDHATTLEVLWQVVGVDPVFGHVTPVNLAGQTVGPFPPGAEVRFKTRVSNSAGEAESEVKSITL